MLSDAILAENVGIETKKVAPTEVAFHFLFSQAGAAWVLSHCAHYFTHPP
jgi:hypothetical protein